jgi:hypothetical protein
MIVVVRPPPRPRAGPPPPARRPAVAPPPPPSPLLPAYKLQIIPAQPRAFRVELVVDHGPRYVDVSSLAGGEGGSHIADGSVAGGVLHGGVHLGARGTVQEEHGSVGGHLDHSGVIVRSDLQG